MLLPSALSCESRQQQQHHQHQQPPTTRTRFAGAGRLFPSTPTPSDDTLIAGNGLLGTCRALQSLLNVSPASSPRRGVAKPSERLQSPLEFRPHPRTRSQRVVKPKASSSLRPPPPRGVNKRRREVYEADRAEESSGLESSDDEEECGRPRTPKRRRKRGCAPLDLPFGLDTEDFKSLDNADESQESTPKAAPSQSQQQQRALRRSPRHAKEGSQDDNNASNNGEASSILPTISSEEFSKLSLPDGTSDWTSEDDRRLVELVLEKLKLSKRDWNDCARRMGKDHDSVGRRWKALVGEGNVGLRRGRKVVRGRIDETWRR